VDEQTLLGQVVQGDERAFSQLYDRYWRPVYAIGIRLLGDVCLAEDLVQDVFISVWQKASSFNPERASFATWLNSIARNRATDLDRRRRIRPSSAGQDPLRWVPGGPQPEESVDGWDVARALAELPDKHRELLLLAYFEGLSQSEISRRTGIPLGTVKTWTTAGLKMLQCILSRPATEGAWYG
jgi:RNA polymerase sigma-70 factor, ECF subfamily